MPEQAQRPVAGNPAPRCRGLCRDRRAGRLADVVAPVRAAAVAGDHPQRHGRPRGVGPAVRPAHLGRPAADRSGPAPVRRRDSRDRQPDPRRAHDHRSAVPKLRPERRPGAGKGVLAAERPVAMRGAGHGAQDGGEAASYRIRQSRAGPRARRPGRRKRRRGEPRDRRADRHAGVEPGRGEQLPDSAHDRPHAGRMPHRRAGRNPRAPLGARCADLARWSRTALPSGPTATGRTRAC